MQLTLGMELNFFNEEILFHFRIIRFLVGPSQTWYLIPTNFEEIVRDGSEYKSQARQASQFDEKKQDS